MQSGSDTNERKSEIGTCIQGRRNTEEDFLAVAEKEVKDIPLLSWEASELALYNTFNKMQLQYGQTRNAGSTACVAITWIDSKNKLRVITAHVGDSSIYLVVINNKKIKSKIRLNRLHKPTDLDEYARITGEGGSVILGRLSLVLSVSRSIGDTAFENHGLSHIPDVYCQDLQLEAGDQALVIVASDGLDVLSEYTIGMILKTDITTPTSTLAKALVDEAVNNYVHDDVSVAVIRASNIPASAAVFDGHNGKNVAEDLANNFYPTLHAELARVLTPEGFLETKQKIQSELLAKEIAKKELAERKEKNLMTIKVKFEFYLKGMTTTDDLHVFIKSGTRSARSYSLIFAIDFLPDVKILNIHSQIRKLAQKYNIPTNSYLFCGEDEDPKKHRIEITYTDEDELPAQLDILLVEIQKHLFESFAKKPDAKLSEQGVFAGEVVVQKVEEEVKKEELRFK